jgi:hypothetical protein
MINVNVSLNHIEGGSLILPVVRLPSLTASEVDSLLGAASVLLDLLPWDDVPAQAFGQRELDSLLGLALELGPLLEEEDSGSRFLYRYDRQQAYSRSRDAW